MSAELVADVMAETGASHADAVIIAKSMIGESADDIVLPPCERPTIRLALAVAGQWRMVPMGLAGAQPIAFDLTAVDVAARWLRIPTTPELFDGLAIIEREALKLMRKK